jgi:3-isopropylmalate/(R)-2-methylmalate dehydratase small subunit
VDIIIQSRVLSTFGDSVSTDDMFQSKYMISPRPEDLGRVCMHDLDPDFPAKMAPGGFLVAGKDFGCGSSRERAPMALKAAGVRAIIAEEFARIFYRNALNICLPVVECPDASERFALGDELRVDLSTGTIQNLTKGKIVRGVPIPAFLLEMMQAGGLVAFLKQQLARERPGR